MQKNYIRIHTSRVLSRLLSFNDTIMLHKIMGCELHLHSMSSNPIYPPLTTPRVYDQANYQILPDDKIVMIIPEGAIMVHVVNTGGLMYIQTIVDGHTQWNIGSGLLYETEFPPESSVQCVLYFDKENREILGVFDVIRLNGVELSHIGALQRHIQLRESMKEHTVKGIQVRFLWVGYEKDCLRAIRSPDSIAGLHFNVKCIGRIPEDLKKDCFERMLPPLVINGSANVVNRV